VTGEEKAAGAEVRINQIETSEFPKVTIFATVLKDGLPVQGLGASDFRVREDEVDQEPITVVSGNDTSRNFWALAIRLPR
jgi:hypothetical protein